MKNYKTILKECSAEIIRKKSRFIATVKPVLTVEEAAEFINEKKSVYKDARHNCSAYIVGASGEFMHCNDDGEPAKTAGAPMLEVLKGDELSNVVAVVTRYFGGTLLGTGGLVRAYGDAVREAIKNGFVIEKKPAVVTDFSVEYQMYGKIEYMLNQMEVPVIDVEYGENVKIGVALTSEKIEIAKSKINGVTNGKAIWSKEKECYVGIIGKKAKIFEA